MKRSKDRLYRVIVVGATPSGIAATGKLAELGVPVTLVDSDYDLDKKLSREEWKFPSGVAFNYANRSGLLRILRNRNVRTLLPASITSFKHTSQGFRLKVKRLQTFVDEERCTLCGKCSDICPVISPDGNTPIKNNGRRSLPGRPFIDKRNQPPCQKNCPLGVNVQAYMAHSRAGRFSEALDVIRRDNILPGICGRICTHPCEATCRRGDLDQSLAIRDIKRFLADYELSNPGKTGQHEINPVDKPGNGRVAIIGSGPSGLAAAGDLAKLGYTVTVFEKEEKAGGLLRYGIGMHRLPRDILDYELDIIKGMGVSIMTSSPVSLPDDLDKLKRDYDRIVIASGSWADRKLGVPGEDFDNVQGCLDFLVSLHRGDTGRFDSKTAVIGDGNAAFDLARTLKRIGADVTIVTWFPKDLIPADKEEVRGAIEEGISIVDRVKVIAFDGSNGKMDRLVCKPTKPGVPDANGIAWPLIVKDSESFELAFDHAVVAIGQTGSFNVLNGSGNITVNGHGYIETDESFRTSLPDVYATGDSVTGPSTVVSSMAAGRKAAYALHRDVTGDEIKRGVLRPDNRDFSEIPRDIPHLARQVISERQPDTRNDNFLEVSMGLSESQVLSEAQRCLQCGSCSECLACLDACVAIGAMNHADEAEDHLELSGVVIIADPEVAPIVKGEDIIRAYGPKVAKNDVNSMITRGYASAAQAMSLLGETFQSPKGRVTFSPPDPELSHDIRIGVFVCRCNDSHGWQDEMGTHVASLVGRDNVVYSEVMTSACLPEATAGILRAIRENGITRVVLSACVCCPLDFVCSACTDQRSRLKYTLFSGTGVSRSMVETCDMRGEVLRHIKYEPDTVFDRFKGLLGRCIHRASKLKQLPAPARTYNFATAVIGESESIANSAFVLAESGMEVLLFGNPDDQYEELLDHPNIHRFSDADVKGIRGTLGDFQIYFDSGDSTQVLPVGTVILGEKARKLVPYIHQEGLPPYIIEASIQKKGVVDIPFLFPGTTNIAGLFLASPPGLHVSERKMGFAAAMLAAAVMPRGPRQNKGFTVEIDESRCRGCGRCDRVCPYHAITFNVNSMGGKYAVSDKALCKGCGNCTSVCPSNAVDSPFRNQGYLEKLIEEILQ